MGYMTRYALKWKALGAEPQKNNCPHKVPKDAKFCPTCGIEVGTIGLADLVGKHIQSSEYMRYALFSDGVTQEACKWYEHEADMKALSETLPEVLFILSGEGEESGDLWCKYFLNGKMQTAKATITVAPFSKELCNE